MKRIFFVLALWGCSWGAWAQNFAEQSVLSEGNWYKIGITEEGIYRIDAAFLSDLGLDVNNLDPRRLQLYGNGGGMLPQPNATPRPDDLIENAVLVTGEADGAFDAGDALVFYGQGPHRWKYNAESQLFAHRLHHYADTNYYYLRVGSRNGLRVETAPDPGAPTYQPGAYRNFAFHENTIANPMESGRIWLGEPLSGTGQRFPFHVPDAQPDGEVRLVVQVAARAEVPTFFVIEANGEELGTVTVNASNIGNNVATYYFRKRVSFALPSSAVNANDSLQVRLTYLDNNSSLAEGWLDWIEVEYDQASDLTGQDLWLGSLNAGVAPGEVADLAFTGTSGGHRIWDVSRPTEVQALAANRDGGRLRASVAADTIRRLAVFSRATRGPASGEAIPNQDLHGLPLVDYLVITHPDFLAPAQRLAQFHRDHYQRSAAVVTVEQILNEFSSGKLDPTAIRDFIRMQYVRSGGLTPGFVCLFGDGSYIYKYANEATNGRSNFVPTYQSRDSDSPVRSYSSDDYYGMMDEEDGFWGESSGIDGDNQVDVSLIDLAIGRLPVETAEQGEQIVDKIMRYATHTDARDFGNWRNRVVLVGDYREEQGSKEIFHIEQADGYTNQIQTQAPCMNIDKIFMDNYRMVVTAGAEGFPEGRQALLKAWDQGSLILNYTGHGGENAWSNAGIFQNADIPNLDNDGRYPVVVTATCEYGRYDNPAKRSGGELLVMSPNTGAIALFTTGRLVYSSFNATLNNKFYQHVFTFDSVQNRFLTLGEIMQRTKNSSFRSGSGTNINSRNFTLLGDPGLILNYPRKQARITHINERPVDPNVPDSLQSLGLFRVEGVIEDEQGAPMPNFEGRMDIDVFDKPSTYITKRANYTFRWQNNRIFRGQTEVKEGAFAFEFVVPIDISYENGKGKISLYFSGEGADGSGCVNDLYVGGTDPQAEPDREGPRVELFINDTTWEAGGITGPNPDLLARVYDENGINTTGNGIGREIIAVLDENEEQFIVLNDFYRAEPGSYQRGTVRYPLSDIPAGEHQLRIRVWDVANNASEDVTTFLVVDDLEMAVQEILFAPNPLDRGQQGQGRFFITHNQNGFPLEVVVNIMDPQGRRIKQLRSGEFQARARSYEALTWDISSDTGEEISSGIYVYQVLLRNLETGQSIREARKLVIMR